MDSLLGGLELSFLNDRLSSREASAESEFHRSPVGFLDRIVPIVTIVSFRSNRGITK